MSELYGTAPLPVALDPSATFATLHIRYDPSMASSRDASQLQQPIQQEIASFTAENADFAVNGASVVAVNQHFVIYVVKKGLIRVLHRHSSMKSLFRHHQNETVSDIQIFQNGEVLGSVSAAGNGPTLSSKVVVWRVHERTSDIMTSPLLEIQSRSIRMVRIIWHPSDMNQFWLMHNRGDSHKIMLTATLINTTRINTKPDPTSHYPIADFSSAASLQQRPTLLFSDLFNNSLQDLSWCGSNSQYTVAAYENGDVVLYDLNTTVVQLSPDDGLSNISRPAVLQKVNQGSTVTRCILLPHFDALSSNSISGRDPTKKEPAQPYSSCFLTGGEGGNAEFTLWSSFSPGSPPMKIQVVQIAPSSRSYVLNTCFGPAPPTGAPPSCFITACCREFGNIFAFHLKAAWSLNQKPLLVGSDYVVPFSTNYPILSSTVTCAAAADITEEVLLEQGGVIFDMKLFVYQTAVVQCLTLTSYMCLPPAIAFTDSTLGVTVTRTLSSVMPDPATFEAVSDDMVDSLNDFEEYDVEDDEEECVDAPEPSSMPEPNRVAPKGTSSDLLDSKNPFANWLGAVAAKSMDNSKESCTADHLTKTDVKIVPPAVESSMPPIVIEKSSLLSPMEILGMIPVAAASKPASDGNLMPKERHPAGVDDTGAIKNTALDGIPSSSEVQAIVHEEIQSLMIPIIRRELKDIVEPMSSTLPSIRDSVEQLLRQLDDEARLNGKISTDRYAHALALTLQEPFRASFTECIRTILLPSMESITNQVYAAVWKRMDDTLPAMGKSGEKLHSISKQLTSMNSLVMELTKEVNLLRSMMSNTPSSPAPMNPLSNEATAMKSAVDPFDKQRTEILQFLKDKNYELAFRRAVANSTVDMTFFCCRNASLQDVFAGGQSKLSQPILLCILQQLGTLLGTSSDLAFVIEWLQEIALSLYPPVDPQIQPHLPIVVKQVAVSLSERMEQESNELTLQRSLRKLQSLLRGMLS